MSLVRVVLNTNLCGHFSGFSLCVCLYSVWLWEKLNRQKFSHMLELKLAREKKRNSVTSARARMRWCERTENALGTFALERDVVERFASEVKTRVSGD